MSMKWSNAIVESDKMEVFLAKPTKCKQHNSNGTYIETIKPSVDPK